MLSDGGRCGEVRRLNADEVNEAGQAAIGLVLDDEVALGLTGTKDTRANALALGRKFRMI